MSRYQDDGLQQDVVQMRRICMSDQIDRSDQLLAIGGKNLEYDIPIG